MNGSSDRIWKQYLHCSLSIPVMSKQGVEWFTKAVYNLIRTIEFQNKMEGFFLTITEVMRQLSENNEKPNWRQKTVSPLRTHLLGSQPLSVS